MAELPGGTVTFLFTDIEGSTQRWQQHPQAMPAAVARHERLLREAIGAHGGAVFKTVGDAVCAAFPDAVAAAAAALTAQRALYAEPWGQTGPLRVRMALHTGVAQPGEGDYAGGPLNRVARVLAAGHGGQVLLSGAAAGVVADNLPAEVHLRDLGTHQLKDLYRPEHIFQLVTPDLPGDFSPLRTEAHLPPYPERAAGASSPAVVPAGPGRRFAPRAVALAALLLAVGALGGALLTRGDGPPAGKEPTPAASLPPAEALALLTEIAELPPGYAAEMMTAIAEGPDLTFSPESAYPAVELVAPGGPALVAFGSLLVEPGTSSPPTTLPGPLVVYAGFGTPDQPTGVHVWVGGAATVVRQEALGTPAGTEAAQPNDFVALVPGQAVVVPAGTAFSLSADPNGFDGPGGVEALGFFPPGPLPPPLPVLHTTWVVWGTAELGAGPLAAVPEVVTLAPGQDARLEAEGGPLLVLPGRFGWFEGATLRLVTAGGAAQFSARVDYQADEPPFVVDATPAEPGVATELDPTWPSDLFLAPGTSVTLQHRGSASEPFTVFAIRLVGAVPDRQGTPTA